MALYVRPRRKIMMLFKQFKIITINKDVVGPKFVSHEFMFTQTTRGQIIEKRKKRRREKN